MKQVFLSLSLLLAAFSAFANEGAVYTATNAPAGNEIVIFDRAADGSLAFSKNVSTGGLGSGNALRNQGAIALSEDHALLFVVNAGSNDISSFAVGTEGLTLVDRVPSGGVRPVSLTVHDELLYVLNAGGQGGSTDNISGFTISAEGKLTPIAGSSRRLSGNNTGAAQISFNNDGTVLVVTEKDTAWLDTYTVDSFGVAHGPKIFGSAGATPFGFAFGKRNQIIVSEAPGSAASSYSVSPTGDLRLISASVPDTLAAACWVVITNDGRYAYVANAGSSAVSGYAIAPDGTLTLLDADGRTGVTAPGSVDEAISGNGRYLYVLNAGSGSISAFTINANGSLEKIGDVPVTVNSNGLVAQ